MQIKKMYMTKKRKAKISQRKAIILLTAIMIGSAIIGHAGQWTENDTALAEELSVKTPIAKIAEINVYEITGETIREVTAYNAGDPAQTDASPCIGASGENICAALARGEKRCAANFVALGSELFIENYGQCKVTDRLAKKFNNRVDIAMQADEKDRAIKFGKQNLVVKILVKK